MHNDYFSRDEKNEYHIPPILKPGKDYGIFNAEIADKGSGVRYVKPVVSGRKMQLERKESYHEEPVCKSDIGMSDNDNIANSDNDDGGDYKDEHKGNDNGYKQKPTASAYTNPPIVPISQTAEYKDGHDGDNKYRKDYHKYGTFNRPLNNNGLNQNHQQEQKQEEIYNQRIDADLNVSAGSGWFDINCESCLAVPLRTLFNITPSDNNVNVNVNLNQNNNNYYDNRYNQQQVQAGTH